MTSLFRVGDARELCSNGRNFPAIYLNHSTGQGPGSLVKNKDPENICNGYFISLNETCLRSNIHACTLLYVRSYSTACRDMRGTHSTHACWTDLAVSAFRRTTRLCLMDQNGYFTRPHDSQLILVRAVSCICVYRWFSLQISIEPIIDRRQL